jgi:integrase/recombinase XerD
LRIIKNRKPKYINLNVNLTVEQWDEEKKRVKKNHPNVTKLNAYIAKKVAEAEGVAVELETHSKYIGSYKIKEALMGKALPDFFPYADQYANSFQASGKIGTYKRAKSVINKLREYIGGKPFLLDQFTVSFLKDYEYYLLSTEDKEKKKKKNRVNTVHANFRLLRTYY